jgi:hypothetical protein
MHVLDIKHIVIYVTPPEFKVSENFLLDEFAFSFTLAGYPRQYCQAHISKCYTFYKCDT